ncbi:MAG: DJ-1/PfpI family protein [Myxococcales bacterium]|nr:DJ-1/PfpI family protein [Myxococcales bacterium]
MSTEQTTPPPSNPRFGFVIYPRFTLMDVVGPFEIFGRVPGAEALLVAERAGIVRTDLGVGVEAAASFDDCPELDALVVPGGPGQREQLDNAKLLDFLRQRAPRARWITSVCTGSLLLGAAGLLEGYQASCHWAALDQLAQYGATPVSERYVIDRDRASGGGVTAGIDFALALVGRVWGEPLARALALGLEYRPSPPFDGGHPSVESEPVVAAVRAALGR